MSGQPEARSNRRNLLRAAFEPLERRRLLATFLVQNTLDDGSSGSLRWAILLANAEQSRARIDFAIPGEGVQTIQLESPLPALTQPVVIDATTQPGYALSPLIRIDGVGLGDGKDGLILEGGSSVVRGLAITNVPGAAIRITGPGADVVESNVLGADPTGSFALPNGIGVLVASSSANTIGGTNSGSGNLVSGNLGDGILIRGTSLDTAGNFVLGNLIGTTADGLAPLANQGNGIAIVGAVGSLIGSPASASGNVVSANTRNGISLSSGATGNLILSNTIGLDVTGAATLGNRGNGISLDHSPSNSIGGTSTGAGNRIGGNSGSGILAWEGSSSQVIVGNWIGTDATGLLWLGNQINGITLNSSDNSIGGIASNAGNLIAHNGQGGSGDGIRLVGSVNHNSILSNSIYENAGLGINLGNGPTPNHAPGPGPNDWRAYPTLSRVTSPTGASRIVGVLQGVPSTSYTVQYFANPTPDPSGFGEGKLLIGTETQTTDSTGSVTFDVNTAGTTPGDFLSATATDPDGNTSEFSGALVIRPVTDLIVLVAASTPLAAPGMSISFVVTVNNMGNTDAHNVQLINIIPDGALLNSAIPSQGWIPMAAGSSLTAYLGSIPARGTATLTLSCGILDGFQGSITDQASATMSEPDPTPENNQDSATILVAPLIDLVASLESSSPALDGKSLTYTVTVSNLGSSLATGVHANFSLDPNEIFAQGNISQGSLSIVNGQIVGNLGSLAAGAQASMTVVVTPVAAKSVTARVSVFGDQVDSAPMNNSSTLTTQVLPVAGLVVSIVPSRDSVGPGQALTYTVRVANNGPDAATGVILVDQLPADVSLVSITSDRGSAPTVDGGVVSTSIGKLGVGEAANLVIDVISTGEPGGILTNSASAFAAEENSTPDTLTFAVQTPVRVSGDLVTTIVSGNGNSSVPVGQPLLLTIFVVNNGRDDEPAASVSLSLPDSWVVVPGSASPVIPATSGSRPVVFDLGAIPAGFTRTATLTVIPTRGDLTPLLFTATADGLNAQVDGGENTATLTIGADPAADLSVALAPHDPVAYAGADLTLTYLVHNHGPSPATDVVATIPLPTSIELASADSEIGAVTTDDAGLLSAALGTLQPGQTVAITVKVHPTRFALGTWIASGAVHSPVFDPSPADNELSTQIQVQPSVDLEVGLTASAVQIWTGQVFTLTAFVTNTSDLTANSVSLRLPLPAGIQFQSQRLSQGAGSLQSDGIFAAYIGTLEPGARATLDLSLMPVSPGSNVWRVSVSASELDRDPAGSIAEAQIVVVAPPGIVQFSSPTYTVDEGAGVAYIPVLRTSGSHGTVTVAYHTSGVTAVSGRDFQAISGVLTFLDGQTSQTIAVPILRNPHDNHDEIVTIILDPPTNGSLLGALSSSLLTIRDTDPDFIPPQVLSLTWSGNSAAIASLSITFSEPISPSSASNPDDFELVALGKSGIFGSSDNRVIRVTPTGFDPSTQSITLIPSEVLPSGMYYRLQISSSGSDPVTDLAGNRLAGISGSGSPADYRVIVGQGTSLKYTDSTGNLVTLKVTGGGYLQQIRSISGDGQLLRLTGGISGRSVITGSLTRNKRGGSGSTSIGSIEGLGRFGEIRLSLSPSVFRVTQYPFYKNSGTGLLGGAGASRSPLKSVARKAVRISVRPRVATKLGQGTHGRHGV